MKGSLVYLSLGSNLGDREVNLQRARRSIIDRIGSQVSISGIYETVPWGYSSEHLYLNCCLGVLTALGPLPVMDEILSIEERMGRQRGTGGYKDRIIDIDLLMYEQRILNHPRLILPHPAMEKRRFVMAPLHEMAPELVHPLTGVTVKELLDRCGDHTLVRLYRDASQWEDKT